MNLYAATGRLTKEPETATTQNGKNYARFTLAVDDGKDASGNKQTLFINCIAWNKTAEIIEKYYKKGALVEITGRLHITVKDNGNGNKQYFTEIVIFESHILQNPKTAETSPAATAQAEIIDDTESDLPFELG